MESLLRLSLIMITGFGMPSEANFEHLMGIVSDSICPVFSLSDYKKCIKDFEEELISSEDQSIEILQSRARCCSFTHLKKCVVDATGQSCGQNSAKAVDMIMKSAFEKAKNAVDCRDYDTDLASFVCLPGKQSVGQRRH